MTGSLFNPLLVPFSIKGGKSELATSGDAIMQMCMTVFLSDIDCDVVWPFKMESNWFTKALDFICPSLVDLLSLVTFGGASVAARLAKAGVKTGAKIGKNVAKKITKTAVKAGAKVGGKTGAKTAKKLAKAGIDKVGKKLSKITDVGKKTGKSAGEKAFDKAVSKLPKGMQKKAKNLKKAAGTSRKAKEFIRQKREKNSDGENAGDEKSDSGGKDGKKTNESADIKNNEIYLQNMSKSFGDKAWFLKMIRPEIDTIVDFGGGAGEFCEFIRDKIGRPMKFVIIDNNRDFKS
jgi:hypothetical protein